MAVRRQPLAILEDENADINRGKSTVTKSVGLKAQQPDLSDRITLSNITNKPRSSGLVTPIAPRKTDNHTKGAFGGTFSSAKNGRAEVAPRTALAPASAVKQKKARGKNANPNPRCELTEEEKQKANAWAREGIERVPFSGKDMEVLKAKIAEEAMQQSPTMVITQDQREMQDHPTLPAMPGNYRISGEASFSTMTDHLWKDLNSSGNQ